MRKKIESLRTTPDGTIDRLLKMVTRLNSKINGSEEPPTTDAIPPQITVPKGDEKIAAVVVEAKKEPNVSPLDLAGRVLNTTLGPLTTFGIVIIFVHLHPA